MDIVDKVTYSFEGEMTPINIKRAFVNIFDPRSNDACIVMKYLTGICQWENEMESNDSVLTCKQESLRTVIRMIKKQLNYNPPNLEGQKGDNK